MSDNKILGRWIKYQLEPKNSQEKEYLELDEANTHRQRTFYGINKNSYFYFENGTDVAFNMGTICYKLNTKGLKYNSNFSSYFSFNLEFIRKYIVMEKIHLTFWII